MSLVSLSDAELIQQSRAGEREAFGQLVERHQQRLFAGMVKMLGSSEDAREAVQEAFILAYQKLDTFQGKAAFPTWLHRIAINAAISRKRREKHGTLSLNHDSHHPADPVDRRAGADPTSPVEQQETQIIVRQALDALPDEFRIVLILKEFEGYRYEQIAEIVGIPLGTVRSRIHRARSELREKLRVVAGELGSSEH